MNILVNDKLIPITYKNGLIVLFRPELAYGVICVVSCSEELASYYRRQYKLYVCAECREQYHNYTKDYENALFGMMLTLIKYTNIDVARLIISIRWSI